MLIKQAGILPTASQHDGALTQNGATSIQETVTRTEKRKDLEYDMDGEENVVMNDDDETCNMTLQQFDHILAVVAR